MPGELEWRPSSMAFFLEGRSWPFTTPLHLLRFGPLSPPARIRMGLAVLRLQRSARDVAPFERMTARDWIRRAMGAQAYEKVWGPLLRGKFGDRADDISMAWLWGKLTMRRRLEGNEARQELLGYPRRSWEPLFGELRDRIEAAGGRVLVDRPAARLSRAGEGFEVLAGAPGSFRRGHDPAAFEPEGEPERYDAVVATVPNDVFLSLLNPDLAAAVGRPYLARLEGHRVPPRALPAARARPPLRPLLLDQRRRPRPAVRRPHRAHELRRARALRRPALPLRRQLPRPLGRTPGALGRRAARALHAGAAQGQPRVPPLLGQAPVAASRARRAAHRDGRLSRAHPAARHRRAGARARQHDADLPRGPGHELRRALGRRRRAGAARRTLEQRLVRDRVVAPVAPRVAAQQAPAREDRPAQRPVGADGLHGVVRAGGQVLAPARERR